MQHLQEHNRPAWIELAQQTYQSEAISSETSLHVLYTNFRRSSDTADIVSQLAATHTVGTDQLQILIAGVGFHAGPIEQSYEPYLVDTRLTSLGFPYRLMLLDRDIRPLEALEARQHIFLPQVSGLFQSVERDNECWERFLDETGQPETFVHDEVPELVFLPGVPRGADMRYLGTEDYLAAGLRETNVPISFLTGLANGNISLVVDDVVTMEPARYAHMHIISCKNVLCHLPPEAQAIAIWNMSQLLVPGGYIMVNDFTDNKTPSMLEKFGGWMAADILRDEFSLNITIMDHSDCYNQSEILLTKRSDE